MSLKVLCKCVWNWIGSGLGAIWGLRGHGDEPLSLTEMGNLFSGWIIVHIYDRPCTLNGHRLVIEEHAQFPKLNCALRSCKFPDITLDAGLVARSQYSEGPATGHLDTGFSWFLCVYKQMLRWFPKFQVVTTCFSCSPPDLNLVVTNFMFCLHVK